MQDPAEPSQDEVIMAEIFGVSPEDFRISAALRLLTMEAIAFHLTDNGVESLARWRALRPKLETRA